MATVARMKTQDLSADTTSSQAAWKRLFHLAQLPFRRALKRLHATLMRLARNKAVTRHLIWRYIVRR